MMLRLGMDYKSVKPNVMKSIICFLALALISVSSSLSQESVLSFDMEQKSKNIKKKTYALSNSVNNDLAILVREKKKAYASLFDDTYHLKSKLEFEYTKKRKYNVLLGDKINDLVYGLLYSNNMHNKFCVLTIDFQTKKTSLKEFEVDFKDERYLKTISHNNRLYVLSEGASETEIIIRELNDNYEFEIKTSHLLDLDKKQKLHKNGLMPVNSWSKIESNITKIDNRIPNAIERVSDDNKIYKQDDKLYITFDNVSESTLMYVVSLKDYSIERKEFDYPKGKLDDFKKYNSYFVDDKLFQIASSNKEIVLLAKTLEGNLIKSYYFDNQTPINIKNSLIIQDGKTALPFVTKREFEQTSKFLRKISSGSLGISAYKKEDAYHFTIGGVKQVNYTSGPMMMPTGAPVAINNQIHMVTTYNPVFSSYFAHSTTKSTFFNSRFDLDFNYIKGEVDSNVFEKIENYTEGLKYISGEDVFFHKDQLLLSYFDMKNGNFNLIRF